jgi:integrase
MTSSAIEDTAGFARYLESYPAKYRFIFLVLVDTGFRISDVLNLKVRDVRRGKNITEKKTRKKRELLISEQLKLDLLIYAKDAGLRSEDFLFPSTRKNLCRPLDRSSVYRVFKAVKGSFSLSGVISPHSCRKTFARDFMAKNNDLNALQKNFNHSNKKITEGYLK